MAAVILDSPPYPLFRVGRSPDPLAWPPIEFTGGGRFDDPQREFRVLYCAERRSGCFLETLAQFRPSLDVLARLKVMPDGEHGNDAPHAGVVPDDWHLKRMMGALRLAEGQRFLDLRHPQTLEFLRRELPELILTAQAGITNPDLDMSTILSTNRRLTQNISRWAYEQGLNGIIYLSRFDVSQPCWVLFEGVRFTSDAIIRIARDDLDLWMAATRLGLRLTARRSESEELAVVAASLQERMETLAEALREAEESLDAEAPRIARLRDDPNAQVEVAVFDEKIRIVRSVREELIQLDVQREQTSTLLPLLRAQEVQQTSPDEDPD